MSPINDRTAQGLECSFCSPVSRRGFVQKSAPAPWPQRCRSSVNQPPQQGPCPLARPRNLQQKPPSRVFTKRCLPSNGNCWCFRSMIPCEKGSETTGRSSSQRSVICTSEQQSLCKEIMKNLCSEDGYERFTKQMEDDAGGFENYHVAVFGEPGTDKPFEWVLTGRHDTLRADGNSVEGAAFGGPIFYGHAADGHDNEDSKHTNNVWWYQGEQANKIFRTLDEKQQAQALVAKAEADEPKTTSLKGKKLPATGLAVVDLDSQQKAMVSELMEKMLRPFRAIDAEEVRECLASNGGVDKLRLTYFKEGDIGNDGVWDIWKLEGPAFSWYFRGSPHVHTWLNVARKA